MLIRKYTDEDFVWVNNINQLSYDFPIPELLLSAEIEKGQTWVAVKNDIVIGYLIGKIKHGVPYVYAITVAYTHREQGIATKLFEEFEKGFGGLQKPENKRFWLQVADDNPAQKLYFDLGYRVGYVDEDFYGMTKHALCMYKSKRPFSHYKS